MDANVTTKAVRVPLGTDRFKEDDRMIWGVLPLSIKLSGKDTGGELFVFEHRRQSKGGPPRHVHFEQDEWFYVIAGEYAFEIGGEKFRCKAGDTMFAPRRVPHGWASIGEELGTLLTIVSPVGTFEDFLVDTTRYPVLPSPEEIAEAFAAHNMKVVGPPLDVSNP
jgi:quercetin dioxygenase-like cupin family protein